MIKVENLEVFNYEGALRGMRNPKESWDLSDTIYDFEDEEIKFGKNDLKLAKTLFDAGTEHRKYLRQIFISMDITCNHVFWAEFDTYKVGVTRNSCSKMHKIHVHPIEMDSFSHEGIDALGEIDESYVTNFRIYIRQLEFIRRKFNETHDKTYWRALLEMLPMGYNLKATVTMTGENAANIIHQRSFHKWDEWREFCRILKELPLFDKIID